MFGRKDRRMPESTDGENPGVQGGSVVLDIGGDIGALIVYLPDSFARTEIYISVADGSEPFTHTGVHPRGAPNGPLHQTAVYPELTTGDYQLWHPVDASTLGPVVHIEGGAVAELSLLDVADLVGAAPVHPHEHLHTH